MAFRISPSWHGPVTWYVKLRMRPERFPRLQRKPLINDPSMHHGACVKHVLSVWETKFLEHSPEMDVLYMSYTKFHSPRSIFYLTSSKCTRIGERASISFPHWPWCMSGSLTRRGGEKVHGIPSAYATHNFTYLARGPCNETTEQHISDSTTYFCIMSCFFCSSDVGLPISFCRWSYIIFSTMARVSPSKSDSWGGSRHEGHIHRFINSLAPELFDYSHKLVNFKLISNSFKYFLGNCYQVNATTPHWSLVDIGSGNGLVPSGNKPLPEPVLT